MAERGWCVVPRFIDAPHANALRGIAAARDAQSPRVSVVTPAVLDEALAAIASVSSGTASSAAISSTEDRKSVV